MESLSHFEAGLLFSFFVKLLKCAAELLANMLVYFYCVTAYDFFELLLVIGKFPLHRENFQARQVVTHRYLELFAHLLNENYLTKGVGLYLEKVLNQTIVDVALNRLKLLRPLFGS